VCAESPPRPRRPRSWTCAFVALAVCFNLNAAGPSLMPAASLGSGRLAVEWRSLAHAKSWSGRTVVCAG
jgi:hypothetical protein